MAGSRCALPQLPTLAIPFPAIPPLPALPTISLNIPCPIGEGRCALPQIPIPAIPFPALPPLPALPSLPLLVIPCPLD